MYVYTYVEAHSPIVYNYIFITQLVKINDVFCATNLLKQAIKAACCTNVCTYILVHTYTCGISSNNRNSVIFP